MGVILSRFRKEKSTTAALEGLQEKIQELEKYMINTQERKRRFVGNFLGITIGIYIVCFALWYFFYFPPTMKERFMNLVPLLIFPILIVYMRQLFTWYFQRKLNKNGSKLATLKEQKTKILEQVKDKETYKVALNLLDRFGEKQHGRISLGATAARPNINSTPALNRSILKAQPSVSNTPPNVAVSTTQQRTMTPYTSVYRNVNNNLNSMPQLQLSSASPQTRSVQEVRRRTPFPIVDERARSAVDRIVDYIVGDNPQDRFGMICKECHAHNGMLPKEEYEYTTFRCAFCDALNAARKERPVAPRLTLQGPDMLPTTPLSARNESSDSGSTSDDEDSDIDTPLTRRALLKELHPTEPLAVTEMAAEMAAELAGETTTLETTTAASHESETEAVQPELSSADSNKKED